MFELNVASHAVNLQAKINETTKQGVLRLAGVDLETRNAAVFLAAIEINGGPHLPQTGYVADMETLGEILQLLADQQMQLHEKALRTREAASRRRYQPNA